MILRTPTENENGRISFDPQTQLFQRVRHSRVLLAGIQAEFGLDPRLKHSGVTVLGVVPLIPNPNFQRRHDLRHSQLHVPDAGAPAGGLRVG